VLEHGLAPRQPNERVGSNVVPEAARSRDEPDAVVVNLPAEPVADDEETRVRAAHVFNVST
jgi:hypothetical protein